MTELIPERATVLEQGKRIENTPTYHPRRYLSFLRERPIWMGLVGVGLAVILHQIYLAPHIPNPLVSLTMPLSGLTGGIIGVTLGSIGYRPEAVNER